MPSSNARRVSAHALALCLSCCLILQMLMPYCDWLMQACAEAWHCCFADFCLYLLVLPVINIPANKIWDSLQRSLWILWWSVEQLVQLCPCYPFSIGNKRTATWSIQHQGATWPACLPNPWRAALPKSDCDAAAPRNMSDLSLFGQFGIATTFRHILAAYLQSLILG